MRGVVLAGHILARVARLQLVGYGSSGRAGVALAHDLGEVAVAVGAVSVAAVGVAEGLAVAAHVTDERVHGATGSRWSGLRGQA